MLRALGLIAWAACSPIDRDLLGPIASACAFGAPGTEDDLTPPAVLDLDGNPGVRLLELDPFDRAVLYASTYQQGVWRSADCGATWTHQNTGINGPMIEHSAPLGFALDPFVPDTLYIGARYGGQSLWTSDSAGVHWSLILPDPVAQPIWGGSADIARIATLPDAPHHLIATSAMAWTGFGGDSGVLEGRLDGDVWTWTAHAPLAGMGVQQELAVIDATTWLVVSDTDGGSWITRDAGASFEVLDAFDAAGDGFQLHRTDDGALYRPARAGLLRSVDNGATWIDVLAGLGLGGTKSIIGDGAHLRASSSIPDGDSVVREFTTAEQPGDRDWMPIGGATSHSISRYLRDELRGARYTLTGDGRVHRTNPTP